MVPLHPWVMWQDGKKKFVEIFVTSPVCVPTFFPSLEPLPIICSSCISNWEIHGPGKFNYTSEETFLGRRYSYALSGNL